MRMPPWIFSHHIFFFFFTFRYQICFYRSENKKYWNVCGYSKNEQLCSECMQFSSFIFLISHQSRGFKSHQELKIFVSKLQTRHHKRPMVSDNYDEWVLTHKIVLLKAIIDVNNFILMIRIRRFFVSLIEFSKTGSIIYVKKQTKEPLDIHIKAEMRLYSIWK